MTAGVSIEIRYYEYYRIVNFGLPWPLRRESRQQNGKRGANRKANQRNDVDDGADASQTAEGTTNVGIRVAWGRLSTERAAPLIVSGRKVLVIDR
jgi:hypothetical protein